MSLTAQRACVGASGRSAPPPLWTTLPPCSSLKPARSGYRKVSGAGGADPCPVPCPIPGLAPGVLEMRVKEGSKIRNLLGFAMARMQGGLQHAGRPPPLSQILFTGSGRAITKTITCAEIMKRQIRGLHQLSKLQYRTVQEHWEGGDSTCSRMTIHRMLPAIYILLSREPLDSHEPGYQPPEDLLNPNGSGYQPPVILEPSETRYQPPVILEPSETRYQPPVILEPSETRYQPPVILEPSETRYQPPVVLEPSETRYLVPPVVLEPSETRYLVPPVELQAAPEIRKPPEHYCMLGYGPPADPHAPCHPWTPAEPLYSLSAHSRPGRQPPGDLDFTSPHSTLGHHTSAEPWPLPHPHHAGERLCVRAEEGRSLCVRAEEGRSLCVRAEEGRSLCAVEGRSLCVRAEEGRSLCVRAEEGRSLCVRAEEGRSLCVRAEEGRSLCRVSRKRRLSPSSPSCQPRDKAALYEDGSV